MTTMEMSDAFNYTSSLDTSSVRIPFDGVLWPEELPTLMRIWRYLHISIFGMTWVEADTDANADAETDTQAVRRHKESRYLVPVNGRTLVRAVLSESRADNIGWYLQAEAHEKTGDDWTDEERAQWVIDALWEHTQRQHGGRVRHLRNLPTGHPYTNGDDDGVRH